MQIILYNIRSQYNVGAIFRTADGIGAGKIYLCGITPAPIDKFRRTAPQIAKTALGAEKSVAWEKIGRSISVLPTLKLIRNLKQQGYNIISIEQDKNSIPYYRYRPKSLELEKTVLVLGNELKGVPLSILKLSDKILEIPMNGIKKSLNVSSAFAVVVYHLKYCRK